MQLIAQGMLPPPVSTSMEAVYAPGFRFRSHRYVDEVEIVYVLHGASYVGIEKDEFIRVQKNDCLVIFPGVQHNFFLKERESCRIIDLVFKPGDMSLFDRADLRLRMRFLEEVQARRTSYLRFIDNGAVGSVLDRILGQNKLPETRGGLLAKLYFCELYLLLSRIVGENRDEKGQPRNIYVTRGLEFLANFYTSRISLQDVAGNAGISTRHFARLFLKEMGMNVQDYLGILRIRKAKDLLENSDQDITRIAYSLGFNSSQYFTTSFKRIEHITPKEYRRLARANAGFENIGEDPYIAGE